MITLLLLLAVLLLAIALVIWGAVTGFPGHAPRHVERDEEWTWFRDSGRD